MRKMLFAAVCAVSALTAAPASAEEGGEGRVELRGGMGWGSGESAAIAGIAAGYDWDLGTSMFGGVEIAADKVFETGADFTFSASARVGGNLGEGTKAYAIGGYSVNSCDGCVNAWTGGAGIQHKVSSKVYLKAEYRHLFVGNGFDDANVILGGVGVAL